MSTQWCPNPRLGWETLRNFMILTDATVLIWLQADLGYKPRPQTSHAKINLINMNCKCIILGYKPRAIFFLIFFFSVKSSYISVYTLFVTEITLNPQKLPNLENSHVISNHDNHTCAWINQQGCTKPKFCHSLPLSSLSFCSRWATQFLKFGGRACSRLGFDWNVELLLADRKCHWLSHLKDGSENGMQQVEIQI